MATVAGFDLRLDENDKDLFAQAAPLAETSMAGFLRCAAKEEAQALIDREYRLTLSQREFGALIVALEEEFAPNKHLRGALDCARRTVRRA